MNYLNKPIEVWFVDLMDGNLPIEDQQAFLTFCRLNQVELPHFESVHHDNDASLTDKEFLRIPEHESILQEVKSDLIVAYHEGLLSQEAKDWLETQTMKSAQWNSHFEGFKRVYLTPTEVLFPSKEGLYKREKNKWLYPSITAAAAVFLIGVLLFFPANKPLSKQPGKSVQNATVNNKLPKAKHPNEAHLSTREKGYRFILHRVPQPCVVEISTVKDCILHPLEFSDDELNASIPQFTPTRDTSSDVATSNIPAEEIKERSQLLKDWIKERLARRVFKIEDESLVFQREARWFNQTFGFKWKRNEERTISEINLGPFVLEWNKKKNDRNFFSSQTSNLKN
jgi:hypothetical protein